MEVLINGRRTELEESEMSWQCQNAAFTVASGGVARCVIREDDFMSADPCDACWDMEHEGDFWEAQQANTKEYQDFIEAIK